MTETTYIVKLDLIDYTDFNKETEDWSGETQSVSANEFVTAKKLQQLYEKIANLCNATVSDINDYLESYEDNGNITTTFTQVEDNKLVDYYLTIYKAEQISL